MRLKIRCDGESEKFCKIFWELNKALVPKNLQSFSDFLSHRIFRRMYEVLNINKNKNKLHSLVGLNEINLLSLVNL